MIATLKHLSRVLVPTAILTFTMVDCLEATAQGPGWGRGRGPRPDVRADQEVFHFLLEHHGAIQREVTALSDGVRSRTISTDEVVAAKLQEHVEAMHRRLTEGRPLRMWDPLFASLFEHANKVKFEVTKIAGGVEVTSTSEDPWVAKMIQAHAAVVSGFAEQGFAEAHQAHPMPAVAAEVETLDDPLREKLLWLSATWDRAYIPALALSNQQKQQPTIAALRTLRQRLDDLQLEFSPVEGRAGELLADLQPTIDQASNHAEEGRVLEAHETLEPLREELARRRRALGLEYPLDKLADFHVVMESIVKPATKLQKERPAVPDAAFISELRSLAVEATACWARVEQTQLTPSYFSIDSKQVAELVAQERGALGRLNQALQGDDAEAILAAAVAIKAPFARLYMSYGDGL